MSPEIIGGIFPWQAPTAIMQVTMMRQRRVRFIFETDVGQINHDILRFHLGGVYLGMRSEDCSRERSAAALGALLAVEHLP